MLGSHSIAYASNEKALEMNEQVSSLMEVDL
jgi:hypothetical protein